MSLLDEILGVMLIGQYINLFLFGAVVVQAYIYFTTFRDSWIIWGMVTSLVLLDTIHTIVTSFMVYDFGVTGFGDIAKLASPGWAFPSIPIYTALAALTVQCFFAWRIWKLQNSLIIPIIVASLSVIQCLCGMGSSIGAYLINNVNDFSKLRPPAIIWLAGSAMCDVIITTTLVWTLSRSRTGFAQTDTIITKLIRGTIETGLASSSFAIFEVITFATMPTNNIHLIAAIPLCKFYSNTLLATLNTRARLHKDTSAYAQSIPAEYSGRKTGQTGSATHVGEASRGQIGVRQDTVIVMDSLAQKSQTESFDKHEEFGSTHSLKRVASPV